MDTNNTLERHERRVEICRYVVKNLIQSVDTDKAVTFSLIDLLNQYNVATQQTMFGHTKKATIMDMEEALLFLSKVELLKIDGGFMVTYNTMQIQRKVERTRRYGKEQYRMLDEFYRQRIQQIHIVGEFANMMVSDYAAAMKFVSDYFLLDYKEFINRYFKGERRAQIVRNITPAKYEQIFGALSDKQRGIIDDKHSKHIVVAAGPGSGKTRVLVHKLASLLLLEDVKHEQLLMLTFSRAAATEFKKRLIALVGNAAHFVEIKTFHSYSFDLIGRQGSLEEANSVVLRAAEMIESGEVEESKIAKSVLVIDEAQDMGADDFRLVKALMQRNEDVRVIAVGDDDQNIYGFRGSNSAYFSSLIKDYNATRYEMTENYRSDETIVDYANRFLHKIPNRLKINQIYSVSGRKGQVCAKADPEQLISNLHHRGQTAVLTQTNKQTLQIAHLLKEQGKHVRLIQDTDGFYFINLAEIRYFLKQLKQCEGGVISKVAWENAKESTEKNYATSNCMDAIRRFFADFEATRSKFYYSDLHEFILESNVEDFIATENDTVFVSTIHKAKGREFDNVHVMLSDLTHLDSDKMRTIYVGLTRARHNLYVYNDASFFENRNSIVISLSMHDVWLNYFKDKKEKVLALRGGDKLQYRNGYLLSSNGDYIASLSKEQREKIKEYEDNNYCVKEAEVSYVIAWQPKEEEQEVAVCLANLVLEKNKS